MAVVTATPVEQTSAFYAAALEATGITRAEFEELDRQVENDLRLHASTLDAINAVNIAVGEIALALEPDDPRRGALLHVQDGLDRLWSASGGPEHERLETAEFRARLEATGPIDRRRLDAAFVGTGHRSSPKFRARLAYAYDRAAVVPEVTR